MSCCNKMEYKKYQPKWDCEPKYDMDCEMDYDMNGCDMDYQPPKKCYPKPMPKHNHMNHMHMEHHMDHHMDMDCCDMDMPKCKTEKTCVKTFKCTYKLYRVCSYKLFKVCPRCNHEYDYF